MSALVRKNVCLDSALIDQVERIAKAKGGRRRGYSFSGELTEALKQHVRRYNAQQEEAVSTPVWEGLLKEKFGQQEEWLRPGVWGAATYSTTAALLLLELMCGKTLEPSQAKDHFELIRGRAWKIVRMERSNRGSQAEE